MYKRKRIGMYTLFISIFLISIILFIQSPRDVIIRYKRNIEDDTSALDMFKNNIVSGGPPKDGIPPIDNPAYISVKEAENFLDKNDIVFVLEDKKEPKIYPQKILVWHEIVNDNIEGKKISITYCPLTGSAIGFLGNIDGIETTFGTSGNLLNSNLVMYDRETGSYWPQILGIAVDGKLKGKNLQTVPLIWTTWEKAKLTYQNAKVLSTNTGFLRPYGKDPYGSYIKKGTYYDSGDPFFPVMYTDKRLDPKEVVIGIKIGNHTVAVSKKKLAKEKIFNFNINGIPAVIFYDQKIDDARVYERRLDSTILTFKYVNGSIIDNETKSIWSSEGIALSGKMEDKSLERLNSFDVMWFAWVAFYPDTKLYM